MPYRDGNPTLLEQIDADMAYRSATKEILKEAREDRDEIERLRKALASAEGYLLNAKIDLETGAPKRTAIMTIDGGLAMIRAAFKPE